MKAHMMVLEDIIRDAMDAGADTNEAIWLYVQDRSSLASRRDVDAILHTWRTKNDPVL